MNQFLLKRAREPPRNLSIVSSRTLFHRKVESTRKLLCDEAAAIEQIAKPGRGLAKCVPRIHIARLDELEDRYKLDTIDIILRFYQVGDANGQLEAEYYRKVSTGGFFGALDVIIFIARNIAVTLDDPVFMSRADMIASISLTQPLEITAYDLCTCGKTMIVLADTSELRCETCGIGKPIVGAVFSDEQFFPQDGQRSKHGDYVPARHGKFWIERILGEESTDSIIDHIPAITAVIKRDKYCRNEIKCEVMRKVFKELKLTQLNDHATSCIKMVGGAPPPVFTRAEKKLVEVKLNKIMDLYPIVCPDEKNKPYYPYFIYKIFEWTFRGDSEKLRVLDYIHVQSPPTVMKNDLNYAKICARLDPEDDLQYIPTQ